MNTKLTRRSFLKGLAVATGLSVLPSDKQISTFLSAPTTNDSPDILPNGNNLLWIHDKWYDPLQATLDIKYEHEPIKKSHTLNVTMLDMPKVPEPENTEIHWLLREGTMTVLYSGRWELTSLNGGVFPGSKAELEFDLIDSKMLRKLL